MSAYKIRQNGLRWSTGSARHIDTYDVLNPSGVTIASNLSWRVARKIADLYNADVEWRGHEKQIRAELAEIAQPYCEHFTTGVGSCYRNGRTELHDERGEYISVCHSCFANRALAAVSLQEEA